MKVFVTGATGFIGGTVARQLRERGDEVVCLVRSPEKAGKLTELGCELVAGDLGDRDAIRAGHGGLRRRHPRRGDVRGRHPRVPARRRCTRPTWSAPKTCSAPPRKPRSRRSSTSPPAAPSATPTTRSSTRSTGTPGRRNFTSYYEQTKVEAHRLAERMIEEGLPCVIVQPGGVYGPGDTSQLFDLLDQFLNGKMPLIPFPELGLCLAHVEDTAGRDRPRPRQGQAGRDLRDRRPADDDAGRRRHRRRGRAARRPPSTPCRPC